MRRDREQRGFTLIEIIFALVVLGILAVVAIPKYYDSQKEAQKKVALGTIAESQTRVNLKFGQQFLASDICTKAQAAAIAVAKDDLGSWKYGTDNEISFTDDIATIESMTNPAGTVITLTNAKPSQPSCTGGIKTN